jgi:hypothetical protein
LEGKINADSYIQNVLPIALEEGKKLMGNNWLFQQDGASAHTAKKTQEWCHNNFHSFIPAEKWPPNSPDLNPLDYSIWTELCHNMDWSKIKNKDTLKDEILKGWKKIRQDVVKCSIDSWSKRCFRVKQNEGNILTD